jgi:hypothetical protein
MPTKKEINMFDDILGKHVPKPKEIDFTELVKETMKEQKKAPIFIQMRIEKKKLVPRSRKLKEETDCNHYESHEINEGCMMDRDDEACPSCAHEDFIEKEDMVV